MGPEAFNEAARDRLSVVSLDLTVLIETPILFMG